MLNYPTPKQESVLQTLDRVHAWAQSIFLWDNDFRIYGQLDFWPIRQELEQNYRDNDGRIVEDCDGFVMLCRYALNDLGIQSRILTCNVEPSSAAPSDWGNHAVLTAEGTGLILDQRQGGVVSRQELERHGYTWVAMSDVRPGQEWSQVIKD